MTLRDPGLQPERTRLAWSRTAFSLTLFGLLCFRGWCRDGNLFYGVSALISGVALTAMLAGWHQRHGKQFLSLSLWSVGALLLLNSLRQVLA